MERTLLGPETAQVKPAMVTYSRTHADAKHSALLKRKSVRFSLQRGAITRTLSEQTRNVPPRSCTRFRQSRFVQPC